MHGESHKPQIIETVQLAEPAELSGISGTEWSTWDCVRPYVQEVFLQVYQTTDDDALSTADAPENGLG